jgi:hypothetical protein
LKLVRNKSFPTIAMKQAGVVEFSKAWFTTPKRWRKNTDWSIKRQEGRQTSSK